MEGELVGGCDIVTEMYESGELAELLAAHASDDGDPTMPAPETSNGANGGLHQIENRLG